MEQINVRTFLRFSIPLKYEVTMSVVDFSRCTRWRGPGIEFFFQLLKYNDDAADIVNDDAGYVADDDGRNRFISTTTVGPRAFKLSSGLPALPACASPQVIKIIVIIVILS